MTAIGLIACGGGMDIQSDTAPGADFTQYSTYDWVGSQDRTGDPRLDNPVLDGRIRSIVEERLTAIGLEKTSTNPDLMLQYHLALDDRVEQRTENYAGGGSFRQYTYPVEYTIGTLGLDLMDTESTDLLWRASAEAEIDENADPDKQTRNITSAVDQMLEQYPGR